MTGPELMINEMKRLRPFCSLDGTTVTLIKTALLTRVEKQIATAVREKRRNFSEKLGHGVSHILTEANFI